MDEIFFQRDLAAAQADAAALQQRRVALEKRCAMLSAIRQWFLNEQFLEVESPVRLPAPALEDYIDAVGADGEWLRTSPELHLKRLLAAGFPRIFEIGPCFRAGESGSRHRTEFTMLEWYRLEGTWRELMADAQALFTAARDAIAPGAKSIPFRGRQIAIDGPWEELTVEEAFRKYASMPLKEAIRQGEFEMILCQEVEPNLGMETPLFLTEYPVECSGLSAFLPGRTDVVARWELYVAGLEIGNACAELVDPPEQERRFQATAKLRAADNRTVYPMDQKFMNAIWNGIRPSAGTAIGVDRMAMVFCNAKSIDDVRAF